MSHTIPWQHSVQPLPHSTIKRRPDTPGRAPMLHQIVDLAADRAALADALREVLRLSRDTSMHTGDRLTLARMRAAEALRKIGEPL